MSADNQQERPNYGMCYDIVVGDLGTSHEREAFYSPDDKNAIITARERMKSLQKLNSYWDVNLVSLRSLDDDRIISN